MRKNLFKFFVYLSFMFAMNVKIFSQSATLAFIGTTGYSLVERTNLRRYENGKYIGLTSREVRSFITPSESYDNSSKYENDQWFDGNFYLMEETKRAAKNTNGGIYTSIPSVFHISANGELTMFEDNGFPSFRSFPSFPSKSVKPGDSWIARAERSVDPKNTGVFTKLKIEVLYTYEGEENYKGDDVYKLSALWQTNYGMNWKDYDGDANLKKALGGHKANILVKKSTGTPILINDNVDETFFYEDGSSIALKGTISLFTEYPPAINSREILLAMDKIAVVKKTSEVKKSSDIANKSFDKVNDFDKAKESGKAKDPSGSKAVASGKVDTGRKTGLKKLGDSDGNLKVGMTAAKNNTIVEETKAGLRLSIRNINFQPDSAELVLGTEGNRIDEIAEVLKLAPGAKFLVEGHTASVGKVVGEQKLSEERARKIASELAKRGVSAESFIIRGWGGSKPIAPNDTNTGRAQNRRVEITILQ